MASHGVFSIVVFGIICFMALNVAAQSSSDMVSASEMVNSTVAASEMVNSTVAASSSYDSSSQMYSTSVQYPDTTTAASPSMSLSISDGTSTSATSGLAESNTIIATASTTTSDTPGASTTTSDTPGALTTTTGAAATPTYTTGAAATPTYTTGAPVASTSTVGASAALTTTTALPSVTPEPTTTTPPVAKVKLDFSLKLLIHYDNEYAKLESNKSKNLIASVTDEFTKKFPSIPRDNFKCTSITEGSVIINITITFPSSMTDLTKNLTVIIKSGKLGQYTVDVNYIAISVPSYPGVIVIYKRDDTSYNDMCCGSQNHLAKFKKKLNCTVTESGATCAGIPKEIDYPCDKEEKAPSCKGNSLNISLAVLLLGYLISKIMQ